MGKQFVSFDPVTMRWLNESAPVYNTGDTNYSSAIFDTGYDDPTYMTFRVEFGGWGASTTSEVQYAAMQAFGEQQGSKTATYNYDTYPAGLLDLNFAEDEIKSRPYYAFNEQITYNAYNYLLQRNEDARAEYIKAFVQGLYEIQRDCPFIFQDISGLDSLNDWDPNRGYRLKDAVITLKCIEGLQQRVRTLMELYMKGAWDAMYQRWVLPENYRQFTMIIYVFERRVFHSLASTGIAQAAAAEQQQGNLGSQILNAILSTGYSNTTQLTSGGIPKSLHSKLNSNIPIAAYECNLCEFDMKNQFGDSYSANWNSSEPQGTTIKIKVKNVRSFYKNGLFSANCPLNNMMIADLITAAERSEKENLYEFGQAALISKDSIFAQDIGNISNPGFGGGGDSTSTTTTRAAWNNMVDSWKSLFGKGNMLSGNTAGSDPESYLNTVTQSMQKESQILLGMRNQNWWHNATVTGAGYYSGGKSFWSKLWNVIKAGTQQIRLSEGYVNAQSGVFYNILDYITINNTLAGSYYSYATRSDDMTNGQRASLTNNLATNRYTYQYFSESTYDNKLVENERRSRTQNMSDDVDNALKSIQEIVAATPDNMESLVDSEKSKKAFTEQDEQLIGDKIEMQLLDDIELEQIPIQAQDKMFEADTNIVNEAKNMDSLITDEDTEAEEIAAMNEQYDNNMQLLEDTELSDIPVEFTPELQKDDKINTFDDNQMYGEIEEIKYEYPNNAMETVRFNETASGTEANSIPNMAAYTYERPETNIQALRSMEEGALTIQTADGQIETLLPIDTNDIKMPDSDMVIIDRDAALKIIDSAESSLSSNMQTIDQAFTGAENMINNMLNESQLIMNQHTTGKIDHIGETDNLLQVAAEMSKETEQIKNEYASHVAALLESLKAETANAIKEAEELKVTGFSDMKDADKHLVQVPQAAATQLDKNITLCSIPRPVLGSVSMQTLTAIEKGATEALVTTNAMVSAMQEIKDEKA